ncbi:MAG: hypothetical protein JWN48_83 [Myxococcaceae bacterium]|nr:hypothetical protein [Myxococcaceae bacterium]
MAYRSGPAGVCGLFAELQGGVASGGWVFTLSEPSLADAGTSAVRGVCLLAGAGVAGVDPDSGTALVHASLTGTLDCLTGELSTIIRGTYTTVSVCSLGAALNDYFFRGRVSGTFEPASGGFVDGRVQWDEPAVLVPPQPGGEGTWSASLVRDAAVTAVPNADCLLGRTFPEDSFPDAGP